MNARLLLCAAWLLAAGSSPASDDPTRTDAGKLEGTWVIESLVEDGQDETKAKGNRLVLAAGKLTLQRKPGQKDFEGSYRGLDASKKPKFITMTLKNAEMVGIYELNGNNLKICLAEPGKERPTVFKATNDWILIVLKRQKP